MQYESDSEGGDLDLKFSIMVFDNLEVYVLGRKDQCMVRCFDGVLCIIELPAFVIRRQ